MKLINNNKLFKTLLLAGFVATSFASASVSAAEFKGIYGGIEGGIKDLTGVDAASGSTGVVAGFVGFRNNLSRNSPVVLGFEVDLGLYTSPSDFRYGISSLVGYQFDDSGMAYAKVGYSRYDAELGNLNGLTLGGGYEMPITKSINARLDYKYIDFKDDELNQGHEITAGIIMSF